MKNRIFSLFICLLAMTFIISCSDNDNNFNKEGNATLELRLTDAPAAYDAVYLDVQAISFKIDDETINFAITPGTYDLLKLNNGVDTLLGKNMLPIGTISQMRLLLGPNNSIVVNGVEQPLKTPSAQESGLKFNVHQTLEPGMVYKMWIDFDAAKSVVQRGNGTYLLKPVIRTYTELTNGMIEGMVLPAEADASVYAIAGQDTVATAIPESDGYYQFSGMDEGVYNIGFDAANENYKDTTFKDVKVVFGQITDLGTLTLTDTTIVQ